MKRYLKKLIVMLICFVTVISILPVNGLAADVVESGTLGTNLRWTLTDDWVLTISGSGEMDAAQYGFFPWNSYSNDIKSVVIKDGVINIADSAFRGFGSLLSVTIPNSVTSIDYFAFDECKSLTDVTLPENLKSIGIMAFSGCSSLKDITIPKSVESIDGYAFGDCSLLSGIWVDSNNSYYISDDRGVLYNKEKTELIQAPGGLSGDYSVPDGIKEIGFNAFSHCSSLTDVTIPNSVSIISDSAFAYCTSLKDLAIPDSVTTIGTNAFSYCTSLESITVPSGITEIGDYCFDSCTSLESIALPNDITRIGHYAFKDCASLTEITIPDNVSFIGSWTFAGCSSLKSITIPKGVTEIDFLAFSGCLSLTGINIDTGNPVYSSDSRGVFFNKEKTELIQAPGGLSGDYSIPDGVKEIGYEAFKNCTSLTSVTIPKSVAEIGKNAFQGCTSLTGIDVEEGNPRYSSDSWGVLFDKEKTELILAPSTISGEYTIPGSVEVIDIEALSECASLTGIKVAANNMSFCSDASGVLYDKDKSILIMAPRSIKGEYAVPGGVEWIEDGAFRDCTMLTSVTIPDSVSIIHDQAFTGCTSLTGIWVNANNPDYTSDDRGVLFNKDKSELYTAPGGIKGAYIVPEGVESIGYYSFRECRSLTGITIPASVTRIDSFSFTDCSSLRRIYIYGDTPVIFMGWGDIFENVTAIVYYPEGNRTWNKYVENNEQFGGSITWASFDPYQQRGDVDGDGKVGNTDLITVARYVVKIYTEETKAGVEIYGDMNIDGQITNTDIIAVAWKIVGLA